MNDNKLLIFIETRKKILSNARKMCFHILQHKHKHSQKYFNFDSFFKTSQFFVFLLRKSLMKIYVYVKRE